MSNLIAALKHEVTRLARKEIRAQVGGVKQAVTQHRREIARLKRELKAHQKKIAFLEGRERTRLGQPAVNQEDIDGSRFSAKSVRAQRKRLKLSAGEFGKLLGVSGQTIYLWEQGKTRPRQAQFTSLVAVRKLGRREAVRRIDVVRRKAKR
ncbi:MAG: helix-turn-helix domain-containing protein [Planctomycetes bacterium]|nr:helix-turn-helix domain-containing protein [Planctomycetota bacterium]